MSVIEYASHMGKQPTVGKGTAKTPVEHSQFARDVTTYINSIREADGLSIRDVWRLSAGKRANSWWALIFKGEKILTTNDIHHVAVDLLNISPFRLVENARALAEGEEPLFASFIVGGVGDAGRTLTRAEELALRQSEHELAAYYGRNEAEHPPAD